MKKISIISSVSNGKLKRNINLIQDAIKSFEGKDIEITIQKKSKIRSNNQNAYYWGIVLPLVQNGLKEATGEIRDYNSIHYQILLPLFSPTRDIVNLETGMVVSEKLTSSVMTTIEFIDYISSIQKWASEFLDINIPDPLEQEMMNFNL